MREPVVPQFDAETYLLWESRRPERFELHRGFLVAFAGGTLDHATIAANLLATLARLYPPPCRAIGSDFKIRVADDTFYYPDASVLCENAAGSDTISETPRAVAEVTSPSTRTYDRIEKRDAYRKLASLRAFLLVASDARRIEVDLRDASGTWRTVTSTGEPIALGNGLLSVADVYARTALAEAD